jgi:hypothetical protein
MQAALLFTLSLSPMWVMAENAIATLPLDASAKDGVNASGRATDESPAANPLASLRSSASEDGTSIDCFYGENLNHPACRTVEERDDVTYVDCFYGENPACRGEEERTKTN